MSQKHPRVTTSRCYICGSSQHVAKDCTRPKRDTNTSSPSNMFQNKGNKRGKGHPSPDSGASPQVPSRPA
eukprot:9206592-Prorocentrum_lima.AAC.1